MFFTSADVSEERKNRIKNDDIFTDVDHKEILF